MNDNDLRQRAEQLRSQRVEITHMLQRGARVRRAEARVGPGNPGFGHRCLIVQPRGEAHRAVREVEHRGPVKGPAAMHHRHQPLVVRHVAELEQRRGEVAARIDPDDLTLYDRIRQMRKGSAVTAVMAGTCRACARRLTPQLENLVMIGNDLVQCMSCSRILYIDDAHGGS